LNTYMYKRGFVCVGVSGTISSLDVLPLRTHAETPGTGVFGGLLLTGSV